MKSLNCCIQDKTMEEQKEILNERFEQWRGSLDRVDDVVVFGIIYSVALWLIIDLQMVFTNYIVTYRYVGLDALLSALIGAVIGLVVTWSLKKYT